MKTAATDKESIKGMVLRSRRELDKEFEDFEQTKDTCSASIAAVTADAAAVSAEVPAEKKSAISCTTV